MKLSCGVVLMSPEGSLFLARATGTERWDLPKGMPDEGERPRDAALREAAEETGIDASRWDLLDLGEQSYRSDKRLHLFAAKVPEYAVDVTRCVCRSTFRHRTTGKELPEVNAFAWMPQSQWAEKVSPNLLTVLLRIQPRVLDLPLQD